MHQKIPQAGRLLLGAGAVVVLLCSTPSVAHAVAHAEHGSGDDRTNTTFSASESGNSSGRGTDTSNGSNSGNSAEANDSDQTTTEHGRSSGGSGDDMKETLRKAVETQRQALDQARQKAAEAKQKVEKAQADAGKRRQDAERAPANKLETAKLRICQRNEERIGSIMNRINQRGRNNTELIDKVSVNVQKYYADKQLDVSGYQSLTDAIAAAKTAAQTADQAVADAKDQFKCDGSDPQGEAGDFKNLTQTRNDAIRAYRDAVKALIKAVKAAAEAAKPAAVHATVTDDNATAHNTTEDN